jgi:hypothetical protein
MIRRAEGLSPQVVRRHFQHTDAWEFIARKVQGDGK